jgi:hypothetical protein
LGLFDLFKPGWQRSDPNARVRAVKAAKEGDLAAIAVATLHEDAFRTAADRLRNDVEAVDLILKLQETASASPQPASTILERQRYLLAKIRVPTALVRLARNAPPEVALGAVERLFELYKPREILPDALPLLLMAGSEIALAVLALLPNHCLGTVLMGNCLDVVYPAAFARLREEPDFDFIEVAYRCPSPAIRTAAMSYVTGIPQLVTAVERGGMTAGRSLFRQRLDAALDEAAARGDWEAIRCGLQQRVSSKERAKLALRLPGSVIDEAMLRQILEHADGEGEALLRPVLAHMREGGWQIEEQTDKQRCLECNGTGQFWVNLDSAFDRDVDGPYSCGSCRGKGVTGTVTIRGKLNDRAFALVLA